MVSILSKMVYFSLFCGVIRKNGDFFVLEGLASVIQKSVHFFIFLSNLKSETKT